MKHYKRTIFLVVNSIIFYPFYYKSDYWQGFTHPIFWALVGFNLWALTALFKYEELFKKKAYKPQNDEEKLELILAKLTDSQKKAIREMLSILFNPKNTEENEI